MLKMKTIAFSGLDTPEPAYIIETWNMFYYIIYPRRRQYEFDSIYPCPIAQGAARFRHDWSLLKGGNIQIEPEIRRQIEHQLKNPQFIEFCKQQKEQFGSKRLYLYRKGT